MASSSRPIYCDHQATTPVDPLVVEAMVPYFSQYFGNPSSSTHTYGWKAEAAVKSSRAAIASAIGADPSEVVFTSGATEANNLAIKGIAEAYIRHGKHIITVATEHRSVLDPTQYLGQLGFDVTVVPVDNDGLVDLSSLEASLRDDTILVSVMAANNEIGVVQPLRSIGQLLIQRSATTGRKIVFHSDAAQAIGKLDLDVEEIGIDLLSLTGHKIYGPKGIGALYVRRRNPRISLAPQLHGGGQERNRRSGTLNPPLIVGLGKAIKLAQLRYETDNHHLLELRTQLWTNLSTQLDDITVNGSLESRLAGNLNVSFAGVDPAALLLAIRNVVALSSGSACSSQSGRPSHVLTALGRSPKLARASLRFGLGRTNTAQEIDRISEVVIDAVRLLRSSPHTQPSYYSSLTERST